MAIIARSEGLKLYMYANDHPPPHFHILYAEHRAAIEIRTLRVMKGSLPPAKLRIVRRWMDSRQDELLNAWDVTQARGEPRELS